MIVEKPKNYHNSSKDALNFVSLATFLTVAMLIVQKAHAAQEAAYSAGITPDQQTTMSIETAVIILTTVCAVAGFHYYRSYQTNAESKQKNGAAKLKNELRDYGSLDKLDQNELGLDEFDGDSETNSYKAAQNRYR